ncbi:hypothetical protein [Georgenia faecalis]|uniref:DUF3784 domain-containing protein n=1 Tax=Georgenia faecalis TaxID=2483799 RepID=A0ABV9D9U2_9MICO|nr:hypothetical protein [Georgenia faecalis]
MLIVGIVLVLVAAALITRSALAISRANWTRLPAWTNPVHEPRGARALRAAGAGLAVLGGTLAGRTIGYWSVLLILAAFLGLAVVHVTHNRRVAGAPPQE